MSEMGNGTGSGRLDRDEVTRLWVKNQDMLRAYLRVVMRGSSLVEDALQETAVVVISHAEEKTDRARFSAWVRGVARHVAFAIARKDRRLVLVEADVLDAIEGQWDDCLGNLVLEERKEALKSCVGKLSPAGRRLIAMRYDNNMSAKEISKLTGRTRHGVNVALSKIHKALSDCVEKWFLARESQFGGAKC